MRTEMTAVELAKREQRIRLAQDENVASIMDRAFRRN
jgi:hypothetical protein